MPIARRGATPYWRSDCGRAEVYVGDCRLVAAGMAAEQVLDRTAEMIQRARAFRKGLGGGMRQAGVLAAAGLIALEQMPSRLHEDHANARLLGEAVAGCDGVEIDMGAVQTNMVFFSVLGKAAQVVVKALKAEGVLCNAIGPDTIRLVTHYDVTLADCERAAEMLVRALRAPR